MLRLDGTRSKNQNKFFSAPRYVHDKDIIFGAIDCETQGLGGPLKCFQVGLMGTVEIFLNVEDTIDFLSLYGSPVIFYSFNASYEFRYLLPYLIDQKYDIDFGLRTQTDIYRIRFKPEGHPKSHYIEIRDAACLFSVGTTLKKFAYAFTPEIPKLEHDHNVIFDLANPEHVAYAKRDVEILLLGMPRLDALLQKTFGIGVGHTAAGTALAAWQNTLTKKEFYKCSRAGPKEDYIRSAYFGGLVFLTRIDTVQDVETYDINSSYPSVMQNFGVPDGDCIESIHYQTEYPAIYTVTVETPPDMVIPILPMRNVRGHMLWRRGTFETTVTNVEIECAKRHGYIIHDVKRGLRWSRMAKPFDDFVNHCKAIRKKFKGKTEETLGKLMQNSVYGKFGANRERYEVFKSVGDDWFDTVPLEYGDGEYLIRSTISDDMKIKPEWSLFITAQARVNLIDAAYSVGVEHVVYGDTDSLTIRKGHGHKLSVGLEYGQFKLEKSWNHFRAIAAKVYAGQLITGENIGACKGVAAKSLTPEHWQELINTGHTEGAALSLHGVMKGLKSGQMKEAEILNRKSTNLENSQHFEMYDDNKIRVKLFQTG